MKRLILLFFLFAAGCTTEQFSQFGQAMAEANANGAFAPRAWPTPYPLPPIPPPPSPPVVTYAPPRQFNGVLVDPYGNRFRFSGTNY